MNRIRRSRSKLAAIQGRLKEGAVAGAVIRSLAISIEVGSHSEY